MNPYTLNRRDIRRRDRRERWRRWWRDWGDPAVGSAVIALTLYALVLLATTPPPGPNYQHPPLVSGEAP